VGALVEVFQVSLSELDPDQLRGRIDTPHEGSESASYALDVQGWAAGSRVPAVGVEFGQGGGNPWPHGGTRPWQVPLDVSRGDSGSAHPDTPTAEIRGFHTSLNTLRLPPQFELSVSVVLEDETRVDFATIRGRRATIQSSFEPRVQPIILTTLGRTGTTMLTTMLGAHPGILVYRPFLYEPAVAGYWLHAFRALSDPASYVRQIIPPLPRQEEWWLGTEPAARHRNIEDPEIETWIGVNGVQALAAFCQSRIESLYDHVADHLGRQSPSYFAEKYEPGWVSSFVGELYPRGREVFVVRDFRDVICSILAFNAKRGFQSFGRQRVETDAQFIDWMARPVSRLLEAWERRADRAHLLRYEDLVNRPSETLGSLLRYLDLDESEATIQPMLDSLSESASEIDEHRTSVDAKASIGRWQQDLTSDLQQTCEAAFGPALAAFGYELGSLVR
jgi:hypothetical protein